MGEAKEKMDLDTILVNEIGQFGRFQLRTLLLLAVYCAACVVHTGYVFTTARIRTRCLIPECENKSNAVFNPAWIQNAIPDYGTSLDNCKRYGSVNITVDTTVCPATLFDSAVVTPCQEYLYEDTNTVVYDFQLACDEWSRTSIGFIRGVGTFIALPIAGYASDRWGRRIVLLASAINTAWVGIVRYWADSYFWFAVTELFEAVLGSAGFATGYILALELVGPKYRVIAGGIMSSSFAVGQMILGLLAWAIPSWKPLTLAMYIPQLLFISYYWLVPESVRWYHSKRMTDKFCKLLRKVAIINGKQINEHSLDVLRITGDVEDSNKEDNKESKASEESQWLVVLVFRYKKVLLRCVVIPLWWVTMTFIYYGLSINALNISGNPYLNFVVVAAVEIPGYWLSMYLQNKLGRKLVLMVGFWICAACQIAYIFMSKGFSYTSLVVYLLGKFSISTVLLTNYVYTSELFPTEHRQKLCAYCSMIGRIGSISAPMTPAIGAATFPNMPFWMFAGLATISGLTLCLMPETLGSNLPDTMEEAEHITTPSSIMTK